jgi:hypothetical protein
MYRVPSFHGRTHPAGFYQSSCIRLTANHSRIEPAARMVAALGGVSFRLAGGNVYRFGNTRKRDAVLDIVRCMMGWTIAEPFHDVAREPLSAAEAG